MNCFFASDLHGHPGRYRALFAAVADESPTAVFLGGDLLPSGAFALTDSALAPLDFLAAFMRTGFATLRDRLGDAYPAVFLILGNDDPRIAETEVQAGEADGLWLHLHNRRTGLAGHTVFGYACVPPTPFLLKDWERYDASRFADPGCVSPEEGLRTVPINSSDARYGTIARDLAALVGEEDVSPAVFLFHTPPHGTRLDRAALDGQFVDGVPLDPHVGSIAVRRFIEQRQPLVTLHGHVHESARLTGSWQDNIGRTVMLSAAHDGPELALVRFDLDDPTCATRDLLAPG